MTIQAPDTRIEETADGSRTLYVPVMDEHYHSVKGARTESRHVFINLGFEYLTVADLHILEIGFGTGLNAYLTLQAAETARRTVRYTAIELYPLPVSTIRELHYSEDPQFLELHLAAWNENVPVTPAFTLFKAAADFTRYKFVESYDLIYFDAFAPEKQPEMWSQELFDYMYVITNKGGVLTTYCAKGIVRRMLQAAGFTVERLPGPPGGKREVLRAIKS